MVSTRPEHLPVFAGSADPRRIVVNRVLTSPTFAKSERLSSFLSCVCELTLNGRADEISEQKIGTMLFGKSANFDSSIDGIVRTQASRLRQRLDLYFDGEGSEEPIRIRLPRGSYVPTFEERAIVQVDQTPGLSVEASTPMPLPAGPELRQVTQPHALRQSRLPWILVALLSLAVTVILFAVHKPSAQEANASVINENPLWRILFVPDKRTIVVPGDSGLVMFQAVTKKKIGLADYLAGEYRSEVADIGTTEMNAADLAKRRYTSIVDLEVVKNLSHVADVRKSTLDLRYARDLRPNELQGENAVLIGATATNPWVELFEPNLNFVFSDPLVRQYTLINRKPSSGEPTQWISNYGEPSHRVYGVVAFLPNLDGSGSVLILEGTSMPGTESAWNFVYDSSQLLPFLARIKRANGTVPHFQCVLGTDNMNGSSVKSTVLAWRVMD